MGMAEELDKAGQQGDAKAQVQPESLWLGSSVFVRHSHFPPGSQGSPLHTKIARFVTGRFSFGYISTILTVLTIPRNRSRASMLLRLTTARLLIRTPPWGDF